ncbi:N-acetylmuramoyl-L-alanine amidase [Streptomyces sp. NPDC056454]|uniref:N-acetylmuramoyl-L-alanine amidase n=1 Tax=Streptomyces sp. NPDC056454 TaxID=3345823 RepID=UPI003673E500
MTVQIISRAAWGARPWNNDPKSSGPARVPLSSRTEFFVHYDGASHITATGNAIPQAIDRQHQAQGWAGIGYNFVISQAGEIYEGRGWDLQGAHCPGHNISGLSVQIAIGGDQEPSKKALAACRALYDESCDKTRRSLAKKGHKDGLATLCPGTKLYAWVQAGMPADGYSPAPGGHEPPKKPPVAAAPPFPGRQYFVLGAKNRYAKQLQTWLHQGNWGPKYLLGPSEKMTKKDLEKVKALQQHFLAALGPADGLTGPKTWQYAWEVANGKRKK